MRLLLISEFTRCSISFIYLVYVTNNQLKLDWLLLRSLKKPVV